MASICNKAKRSFQFSTLAGFIIVQGNGKITHVSDDVAFEIKNKYSHLQELKDGSMLISIDEQSLKSLESKNNQQNIETNNGDKQVSIADHNTLEDNLSEERKKGRPKKIQDNADSDLKNKFE